MFTFTTPDGVTHEHGVIGNAIRGIRKLAREGRFGTTETSVAILENGTRIATVDLFFHKRRYTGCRVINF